MPESSIEKVGYLKGGCMTTAKCSLQQDTLLIEISTVLWEGK